MDQLNIKSHLGDSVDIFIDPVAHPNIYTRKKKYLMDELDFSEEEAEHNLRHNPIRVELYYDFETGLFALEAEIIDCEKTFNPFTGKLIPFVED